MLPNHDTKSDGDYHYILHKLKVRCYHEIKYNMWMRQVGSTDKKQGKR